MILDAAGEHAEGWVLDNGCGVGAYLVQLASEAKRAYGLEIEFERAREAVRHLPVIVQAQGEHLPYPARAFDLVLSHEVLEHVDDDRAAVEEMVRVLRPPDPVQGQSGGRLILFVPNRGYPFETHGVFWGGRYRFGNIPLINYLPMRIRNRLAPHVRVYTRRDLEHLFEGLPLRVQQRSIIYGAYDNLIARWPRVGRALRSVLHTLERTPLRVFGLSHFWVFERIEDKSSHLSLTSGKTD
jgi:SAM-dependent methyltransferase